MDLEVKRALVSFLIESKYENPNREEARRTAELQAREVMQRWPGLVTVRNAAEFAAMVTEGAR